MRTRLDELIQEYLVFVLPGLSGSCLAFSLMQTLVMCLGLGVLCFVGHGASKGHFLSAIFLCGP